MTGMYPNKSGVPLNCHSLRVCSDLPQESFCLTDALSVAGYHVGYIGKWHLDFPTPNDPQNPGSYVDCKTPAWDSYTEPCRRHGIDYWYGYGTFDQHTNPHYYDNDGERHEPKMWSAEHEADKAIEFIHSRCSKENIDTPFALFVSMNPPHSPYNSLDDCRESDLDIYSQQTTEALLVRDNADVHMAKAASAPYYFANVSGVDKELGRIIDALKENGEWDNTLVVFTSDHGETLCSHGIEDAKNCIYNESFQVPFILKQPFQTRGNVHTEFLNSPDIMPTLLNLLDIPLPPDVSLQGKDVLNQDQHTSCALYIRNIDGEVDENGDIKSYFPVSRGIKTRDYSLALTINKENQLVDTLLFNNQEDPHQLNNLEFDVNQPEIKALLSLLANELTRIEDPWHESKVLAEFIPYQESK